MAEPATFLITGATGLIGFRILLAVLTAGHTVRYTARSEEKARAVSSNPAVQKLAPGERLSAFIIPDLTIDGVLDDALKGVTHIIHAGSPVPVPTFDPMTEVYQPTVKMSSNILASALKSPSIKRVIITSSIVCNLPLDHQPTTPVTASSRLPLPPVPATFSNVFEGYTFGKIVELHESDEFARTQNPHFTISHVVPGYVFGRNELALDAAMIQTRNSSNNFLMMALQGAQPPFPILSAFAHIDDLAEAHLRVAFIDQKREDGPKDYGLATAVDYGAVFGYVEKAFPKAVAAGVFKKGSIIPAPANYDSSDLKTLLGGELKSFESAVVDVASQYLEKLGVAKE